MRWRVALAVILVTIAGCTTTPRPDLSGAVQPAEIARAVCSQSRPGDDAACEDVRLPDPASRRAYSTCLEYHRLDIKACKDLRAAYESELRAYLAPAEPKPGAGSSVATSDREPATAEHGRVPYQTAATLYKATSADAQTFTAALLIPEIRRRIEAAFRQNLSDERLRQLADQAKSESLYWYQYMQRLERSAGNN
jgi:hypothetical protein